MNQLKRLLFLTSFLLIYFLFPPEGHARSLSAAFFFKSDPLPALYPGIDFTKARLINNGNLNAIMNVILYGKNVFGEINKDV
jgi:hypothetical protein